MSQPIAPTSCLRPHPEVVLRRIAGEHILVPVRGEAAQMDYLFTTNGVGSAILGWLDGSRDIRAIAALVSRDFEVDGDRALEEVAAFLATLLEAGLVVPAGETR